MTANVCRALLTVFLALCLLSGATASDEFSDALMQDACVECGSAGEHLESCSFYLIPDIIDDSFDTDIPDIVEEPLNPEFSGDDLSSSDAVSSGDDSSSSDLLTESTEPPVQPSFAEQLLASDDLRGMYSQMLSAMNEDVGILYALTADELAVLKEHANLLYLSIPEPTDEDMENWEGIIATLTVLEEELAGTYEPVSVYDANVQPLTDGTYIYFDLSAGDVTITGNSYSGSYYDSSNNNNIVSISGDHYDSNKYYVYQSNKDYKPEIDILENTLISVPQYNRVQSPTGSGRWGDYITNNSDVKAVVTNWTTLAGNVERTPTPNKISVSGSGTYNLTIDNLWSSYISNSQSRTTGGISFNPSSGGSLTVNFKGDNRFGNIHYLADSRDKAKIIFNGKDDATLTVASFDGDDNYWNSVIGAADSKQESVGIVIEDGIIYAGADHGDVCTAIGGGGNGKGYVTINGGTVTAVTSSSGAAIGGGIAELSAGGEGYVVINSGFVYAYNLGYASHNLPNDKSDVKNNRIFIPSSAIGGGSSSQNTGTLGTVIIQGDAVVYAESVGGTAIGGGSSASGSGGSAVVTISGDARVTAKSVSGVVYDKHGAEFPSIPEAGAAIGGGKGKTTGGSATLTVSENAVLNTGSIGGGAGNTIGSAEVTINGGTIIGQVIMQGTGSTFTMNGGTIDNADSAEYNFQKTDGGAVWIQTGTATMSGGTIKNTNAVKGGAIYVSGGSFAMSGGNISSTSATANGGAIYVSGGSVSISGGNITDVSAEEGGAVYVSVTGSSEDDSFTISGGTIQNATATKGSGGAVAVANGKASMKGGSIKNSTASADGGAVSVSGGSFAMSGGSIDDVSALNGGAVAVSDGTFTMSAGTIQNSEAIRSDSDDTSGNGGAVSVSGAGSVLMSGGSLDSCSAYNGGGVYVNVTDASGNSFTMEDTASIKSCTASSNGGAVCVEGGNALMKSGSIDGGESLANAVFGGAVYVKGGSFTMENGVISNSRADEDGGAVCVEDGSASMLSGTINSSTATENGGAVSVNGGSFTMSEGTIGGTSEGDCTAENGGAVSVTGGTFTMTSGIIQNSTATADGGAVYVHGGTASVTDGSIRFCSAEDGGAVYVYTTSSAEGDSFIMSGSASVLNCTASEDGGAVCVEGGSARMYDGTIQYCTATLNGGAVYVSTGDFVMDSGNLTQNTATGDGGGACIMEGSITIGNVICKDRKNETHIHPKTNDNKAANGGAFAVSGGTLTIYCGEYAGNQAVESNSNGLYLTNGTVVVGSGVDADSLLTKDIVITGTTYVYSDSRLDISEIKLYRSPGDTSPVTIPVDLKTYNSIRLNQSLVSGWVSPYPGTVLIGWSTAGTDTNTTVLSNPASYYPENSKYPITGGGGVDFYAIWGSAESVLTYTVIIPSVVEIPANGDSGTATVKVDTKQPFFIPNDVGNVNVTLSSFDGELVLQEKEDQKVAYSLLKEDTSLAKDTVVASFAYNGTKNYEDVTISAEVTGEPIYAGTYQETVTFSLSLEMEDYGDKCYQGGST